MAEETKTRIETELEVKAYIQDLKYALNNGAEIKFQAKRVVDVWKYSYFCNVVSFCRKGIYFRNVPL